MPFHRTSEYLRSDNDDEIIDEAPGQLVDDDDDDPITLSGQTRPSSVGLSFMATEWSDIEVEIEAGRYQPAEDDCWERKQLKLSCTVPVRADQASSGLYAHHVPVLDGKASVDVRWRAYGTGTIVTVALVNRQSQREPWSIAADECLFQVVLRCWPKSGTIDRYPSKPHLYTDREAEELELQYRNIPVYAIGHGAAATWMRAADSSLRVQTSFFPIQVVPDVSFEIPGNRATLDLWRLAHIEVSEYSIIAELNEFVDNYL